MRSAQEIGEMQWRLDTSIREGGWDPALAAAHDALGWVLGDESCGRTLEGYLAIPEAERRQAWIAKGGNPMDWPLNADHGAGPVRPGEEPTP